MKKNKIFSFTFSELYAILTIECRSHCVKGTTSDEVVPFFMGGHDEKK